MNTPFRRNGGFHPPVPVYGNRSGIPGDEVMHDSRDYQLVTVEGTEEKVYQPPAYIDERNMDADSFIANFEKFLPLYIGRNRPTEDTMASI